MGRSLIIRKAFLFILLVFMGFGLTLRFLAVHPDLLTINQISLKLIRGLFQEPALLAEVRPALAGLAGQDCNANWQLVITLDHLGDKTGKLAAWRRMLDCPPSYLDMLKSTSAQDVELLRLIVERYPDDPELLFSLAEQIRRDNPAEARQLYLKEVAYNPLHGLSWCRLGFLYWADKQYQEAADAFLRCCQNGDSGGSGCWAAGQTMEELGNLPKAIEYYRLSKVDKALKRADVLEKQIQP